MEKDRNVQKSIKKVGNRFASEVSLMVEYVRIALR